MAGISTKVVRKQVKVAVQVVTHKVTSRSGCEKPRALPVGCVCSRFAGLTGAELGQVCCGVSHRVPVAVTTFFFVVWCCLAV